MGISLGSLSTITTTATTLSNLILVTPQNTQGYQPQNAPTTTGVPGNNTPPPPSLLFHYEGEQTVVIESDITDHYVENNSAIQDMIALRPEIITTHGFIGELNDVTPAILLPLKEAAQKLTVIGSYTPSLTVTAQIAYDEAFQLYQTAADSAASLVSAWGALSGSGGENVIGGQGLGNSFNPSTGAVSGSQNKQQTYFQQFYGYWRARTLFTVQTPWAVFQNMAIQRLRAIQDAETQTITDFEVSFKMIRFANTQTSNSTISDGRAAIQSATTTNLGTSTPPESTVSQAQAFLQSGFGVLP